MTLPNAYFHRTIAYEHKIIDTMQSLDIWLLQYPAHMTGSIAIAVLNNYTDTLVAYSCPTVTAN